VISPVLPHESWLALSDDDRYLPFQDSLALLRESSVDIARAIVDTIGSKSIDFISLGPGNGSKDLEILRSLLELSGGQGSNLYYYPFDISANMVATAMTRVAGDRSIRHRLGQVKAVVADFSALPIFKPVYQYRDGPNVLSFLGTLGNFADDRGVLERLHSGAMSSGDVLLLEVKLRPRDDADPVAALGTLSINKRFDFAPLELLGVRFEDEKLTYRVIPERGTIRGTVTTVAEYASLRLNGKTLRRVQLSYSHGYESVSFVKQVKEIGFKVVQEWTSPRRHSLWVLLQKTPD